MTKKQQWAEEECLQLIEAYSSFDILWNPKNVDHFKQNFKEDAWRDIGNVMRRPGEDCKSKIVNLLGSYRREKSKEKKTHGTGTGKFLFL